MLNLNKNGLDFILPLEGSPSSLMDSINSQIAANPQLGKFLSTIFSHLEALLHFSPEIVMKVNKSKVYTWSNSEGHKFFGEDVIGKEVKYYVGDPDNTYTMLDSLFSGAEQVIHVENWHRKRNGEKRLLAWCYRALTDDEGNVTGALSTAKDITDNKLKQADVQGVNNILENLISTRTEELVSLNNELGNEIKERTAIEKELKARDADMNRAQKIASFGNWTMHFEDNNLYWSDEVYRIFGLSPQEFGATYEAFLDRVHPDDIDYVKESVDQALAENKPYDIEHRIITPDGLTKFVHEQSETFYDEHNKPLKMVGTVLDITLRKEVEIKLERSYSELRKFAQITSHDLQEPLRKVMIFSERLKEGTKNLDAISSDYINRIHKSAIRMHELLDDLLLYSIVENQPKTFEEIDLNLIVKSSLSNLKDTIARTKAVINVDELPAIQADDSQINQLFQNLISNALKYRKEGVSPVINIRGQLSDAKEIIITVEDNGVGFDEKYIERIFQPFQRLHGKDEFEGTGIGLAICKKVVERHYGSISVKSAQGEGTAFIITLPQKQPKATDPTPIK